MLQQISKLFITMSGLTANIALRRLCLLPLMVLALSIPSACLAQTENKGNTNDSFFNIIDKTGLLRWQKSAMPLHIFIKQGDTTNGFRPAFVTLLKQAFAEWAAGSQNRISFAVTNNPSKALIICGWTSNRKDMTKLTEGGHALVVPEGHNIKRVQITILTKSPGGENLSDQFFKRVALHEIGHALGITDHSPNPTDMMYGNPPTSTTNCTLTNRDKNTLMALYNLDQGSMEHRKLDVSNMLPGKDNKSSLACIIRLNAEAHKAMETKNLALAVSKLEEAHHIDPDNDLVNGNLGSAYGNCAIVACMIHENQKADAYFVKALPLLAKSPNRENYVSILTYYLTYLRSNNRLDEAENVEKKVKALSNR